MRWRFPWWSFRPRFQSCPTTCAFGAATADLADFAPITATEGDCYARVKVRCLEVLQSIEIIKELGAKIPASDIEVAVKGAPADGAQASNVLEQPRGECYYYARGNGSKNLERMRMRTPTSQNLAGMTMALKGVRRPTSI